MANQNAQIDENSKSTLIATGSSTQAITRVYVDETSHALLVTSSGSTGDSNITKWGGVTVTAASALADNDAPATAPAVYSSPILLNGIGNMERAKTVTSGFNNSSVGIPASGMIAQFDDAATGSVTEDNFAVARISSRRALLVEGVASGTAIATMQSGFSTVGDGRKTVTTAGSRVQFSSQACKKVIIASLISNTNAVYIGGSTVVAAAGSESGVGIFTGSSITVEVTNMNLLYMDSLVKGEGVSFTWFS